MNKKFKELIDKKKSTNGKMDPMEAAARHSVVGGLMKMADDEGSKKVKGLQKFAQGGTVKKVTVAAPDNQHLMEGLDKAESILKKGDDMVHDGDEDENDLLHNELEESPEYEDVDTDEALDDSPENHIGNAELKNKMSMHGVKGYSEGGLVQDAAYDSSDRAERKDYHSPDEHIAALAKENEHLKMIIEQLKAPKPFY